MILGAETKNLIKTATNNSQDIVTIAPPDYIDTFIVDLIALEVKVDVEFYKFEDRVGKSDLELLEGELSDEERIAVTIVKDRELNVEKLSLTGLKRVERVWEPGEYSVIGDVINIWPQGNKHIYRISVFGNEVENISLVDPTSRHKIVEKNQLRINPVKEQILQREVEFEKITAEAVVEGQSENQVVKIFGLDKESFLKLEEDSKLIKYNFGFADIGEAVVFEFADKDVFYLGELERLSDVSYIDQELPKAYKQLKSRPSKGFILESANSVVLTPYEALGELNLADEELTGVNTVKADPRSLDEKKFRDEVFKKIVPGDYVVHEDHGVGLYDGVVEREQGSYMYIKYKNEDKLFLPISQALKVTKHVTVAGSKPKLTNLDNRSWSRTRKKVEEDAEKVAKELLQLYAMRMNSQNATGLTKEDLSRKSLDEFVDSFKHQDTEDQALATENIYTDIKRGVPMDRLLVGDVGFGKTEVALRAAYMVNYSGMQVAFLAPTTVLVEQHYALMQKRFKDFDLTISKLSRFQTEGEKRAVIEAIKKGEVDIVVGTHSLLRDDIEFKQLGLIIVDEEQKFGVKQKQKLSQKRIDAHVLSMSATPIPRSLNMALTGVKDVSVIRTAPHGRVPVKNSYAKYSLKIIKEFIDRELERDGQIYFVNNRVQNIDYFYNVLAEMYPDKMVGVVHGQMPANELSTMMGAFADGDIDILVATTIIENGLDIPTANTMIINDADRLGLSQLYQLRGRIGRSDKEAYALLLYKNIKGKGAQRLKALSRSEELGAGYKLANLDLEIRGAGNILGKEQSGSVDTVGYGMFMSMLSQKIDDLKSK